MPPRRRFEPPSTIGAVDWILFASIAAAAGLIATTTVMTTLNPYFWRPGIGISAMSSALIAYGVYSLFDWLGFGPPNESVLFGMMILWMYAWLQISVLLVRAAGYRIVVGP
jgi:hypothetical protein